MARGAALPGARRGRSAPLAALALAAAAAGAAKQAFVAVSTGRRAALAGAALLGAPAASQGRAFGDERTLGEVDTSLKVLKKDSKEVQAAIQTLADPLVRLNQALAKLKKDQTANINAEMGWTEQEPAFTLNRQDPIVTAFRAGGAAIADAADARTKKDVERVTSLLVTEFYALSRNGNLKTPRQDTEDYTAFMLRRSAPETFGKLRADFQRVVEAGDKLLEFVDLKLPPATA